MATTYADALYALKRSFLIVGLTGYTGSGCSTAARLLMGRKKIELPEIPNDNTTEARKHRKLYATWRDMEWEDFINIGVGPVIFSFMVRQSLSGTFKSNPLGFIRQISLPHKRQLAGLKLIDCDKSLTTSQLKLLLASFKEAAKLYRKFKANYELAEFISLMQDCGDSIRRYGRLPAPKAPASSPDNMWKIPEAITKIISAYRKCEGKSHFVIDAFRNPYEVEFFKKRYSEFYLVAILRDQESRNRSLDKLTGDEKADLTKRERGEFAGEKTRENISEWVVKQNLDECIQKADMFINNRHDNNKRYRELKCHLVRLIALAWKPGVIPPTDDERGMQIAFTARQMSGCISRQVGAAVVGEHGYILGVGWNDPPEGQTPCSLRTGHELVNDATAKCFSDYEQSATFVTHITSARDEEKPFCFRAELAKMTGKKQAEYTRSLHAEENAFLQTAKIGGSAIAGATLYTTASTCTLCAKKAYQLGVLRIVFVEEYPDLAYQQTIRSGTKEIDFVHFEGVVGAAFFKLFAPTMPEKDLIELYSG